METKTWGACIVANPAVCHVEPTFRGARILVVGVREQVESGMAWGAIIKEWRYAVTRDAIAEVVRMAREALVAYAPKLVSEQVIA
ncbi:MAG: DUF433 domain-containing protein [Methanosarcinales archaeon]|nr:MAG: DUF433 domain-containing protein [Methanosarcinales archaeon]